MNYLPEGPPLRKLTKVDLTVTYKSLSPKDRVMFAKRVEVKKSPKGLPHTDIQGQIKPKGFTTHRHRHTKVPPDMREM